MRLAGYVTGHYVVVRGFIS